MQAGHVRLVPLRVLHPPPQSQVKRGMPTLQFPSDHISLVCDFAVTI